METLGTVIDRSRLTISRAIFWDRMTRWTGWGWLAAGVILLLGKLIHPSIVIAGLAIASVIPLVAVIAAARARGGFSLIEAAILLDRRGQLEGLPLLHLAHPGTEWLVRAEPLLPRAAAAAPQLAPWPFVRRVLPGTFFAAVTLLLPQQETALGAVTSHPNTAARREVERLTEKMQALKEKEALPETEIERLQKELKSLQETAAAKPFTQEGWEGLDHLKEQMHQAARERADRMAAATTAAAALSEASDPDALGKQVDEAAKLEKAEALQRALAGLNGANLPADLQKQVQDLLQQAKSGSLDKVDPKALKSAMKDLQKYLKDNLREIRRVAEKDHNHKKGG